MISFLYIVSDPEIAKVVSAVEDVAPVVDLERLGKAERQGHTDSWQSLHGPQDVTRIRQAVPAAHLIVRVNPLNENSKQEIDDVLARGADSIMFPMFRTIEELARFYDFVDGRAAVLPLFETSDAVAAIPQMLEKLPIEKLHIGLNDLHLDLGREFIFQPLTEGYLEEPAAALRQFGTPFGIGGLARSREGIVSPEYLLGEHVRLGSTSAILSRTFHRSATTVSQLANEMDFAAEVSKLRSIYAALQGSDQEALERNRIATAERVQDVVRLVRKKREIN